MKKVSFATGVALAIVLSGCSGKPSASDVKDVIIETWSPCKLVKISDVKKTNGIDRGNFYQMAISYQVELLQDVNDEDVWGSKIPKDVDPPDTNALTLGTPEWRAQKKELNAVRTAAMSRKDQFMSANCPFPTGSLFHAAFNVKMKEVFENGGSSLNKGETVEFTPEFMMVKTDNGWVIGR